MRCILALAVVALCGLGSPPLLAEPWDPFPRLDPGTRVAVKPRIDGPTYDPLRRCLAAPPREAGADYWAVVVEVTSRRGARGPEDADAVPYAEALADAWDDRLAADHVLMVVSTLNRGVAVHVGERWAAAGVDGTWLQRTIDRSRFGALAREGELGRALCALAEDLDDQLADVASSSDRRDSDPMELGPGMAPSNDRGSSRSNGDRFDPDRSRRDDRTASGAADALGCAGCGAPLVVLLLGAGILGFWLHRRRSAARAEATRVIERWAQLLATAAERLLVLERRHPLYFATGELRWSGESETLDRETAEAVNRLYLLYGAAYSLHDRADREVETARGWSRASFDEALRILRDEPVQIDAKAPLDERDGARTIPLPLREGIEMPASEVPGALESAFEDAARRLAEAEAAEESRRGAFEGAAAAAAAAIEAISARDALELPSGHLTSIYEPLAARRTEAETRQRADPIAAAAALETLRAELEALAARARGGNETFERLRATVEPAIEGANERLEALRAEGHPLREPGFEPALRLERAERQADDVVDALEAGREDAAREALEALERDLEQLREQMEASAEAREGVPRALERLDAAIAQLRERAPRARATLEALRRDHHPDAFAQESDNLEALDRLLPEMETWRRHVAEDHEATHHLSALEDLAMLEGLVRDGALLLDEIDDAEETLDATRARVRESLDAARSAEARVEALRAAPGVATETREALADSARTLGALRLELGSTDDGTPPHWPRLDAQIAALRARLDDALRAADADRQAYDDARARFAALEDRLHDLERRERAETRERPHVETAVRDAGGRAEALRRHFPGGGVGPGSDDEAGATTEGGLELLSAVESFASTLDWAETAFRREVEIIGLAESELQTASRTVARVDGQRLGFGIVTDASEARRLLDDAESARRARRWDDVASLSRRAREAAEEEEKRRAAEAKRLERAERRRLLAAQAAEAAARMARGASRSASWGAARPSIPSVGPGWSGGGGAGSSFGRSRQRPPSVRSRPSRRSGGRAGGSSFGGSSGGGAAGGGRW